MSEYRASEEDMRTYSEIIKNLAMLDLQRNQVVQQLQQWEQAHVIEIPEESAQDPEQPQ